MLTDGGKSHIWRASLSTVMMQMGIPAELRAAQLGHSPVVNQASYLNLGDPIPMLKLAGQVAQLEAAQAAAQVTAVATGAPVAAEVAR